MSHSSSTRSQSEVDTVEHLLAESAWVRRVAIAAARDSALADDVAQDAWIAALERLRSGAPVARTWFSVVIWNLARRHRRSEAHREEREAWTARGERVEHELSTLERLERQQFVLQAVRELDEPYRTVVSLRWLDGLTPAEIAERQALPLRTVHTQLSRVLGRLRRRLRADAGAEPAFGALPWLASLFDRGNALPWILAMSTKSKFSLLGGLLLLVGGLWWWSRASEEDVAAPARFTDSELAAVTARTPDSAAVAATAQDAGSARTEVASADAIVTAPVPRSPSVRGRVVDAAGKPVNGAWIYLSTVPKRTSANESNQRFDAPLGGSEPQGSWAGARTMRTTADGAFEFPEFPTGRALMAIRAANCAPHEHRALAIPSEGRDLGELQLSSGMRLVGRVVDARGFGLAGVALSRADSTMRRAKNMR
jgi:RNA polymerase sigma-70 factor (ECF subfamily)